MDDSTGRLYCNTGYDGNPEVAPPELTEMCTNEGLLYKIMCIRISCDGHITSNDNLNYPERLKKTYYDSLRSLPSEPG